MTNEIRKTQLKVYRIVGLDEETYLFLRQTKKEQKKSMMALVKEALFKCYGKEL